MIKEKAIMCQYPKMTRKHPWFLERFKPFFANDQIEKVGQNLKYDIKVLQNYAIEVKGPLFDTMIAHYLINPDMRHNMDVLSETYLRYTPIPITNLIGKKERIKAP